MEKMTCIIVEDEPLATEVLRDYISDVPHLELVGEFPDAIYGLNALRKIEVEVIFLDIHLPKLKGLEFLRLLKTPPQIILTTAHDEYAIEAFDLEVVDYLLKPIEFERFLRAINKLKSAQDHSPERSSGRPYKYFRVNRANVKVYLDQIIYIESLKDYIRIHTRDQVLVTKGQIGEVTRQLQESNLIRIHRSFSVSRDHIHSYSGSTISTGGTTLPIGRSYREWVRGQLS